MSEINLEHTARDFWATRPRRRTDDRKIAGVAAAIARRYAIDPVLVRVAFVVATVTSGAGVLLYLLGWLLLPPESTEGGSGAEGVVGRGRSSMSAVLTIVLVLLLVPITAAVFGGHGSGIIGLAVGLGALLLLHRSRAALGEIPGSPPSAVPSSPSSEHTLETAQATTPQPGATTSEDPERPAPPAWDPLGAAPFAWDLPEPSTQPAPTTPPGGARSKITPITLGLALLAGGIALAFGPALSAAQIAAVLLGVVGLGLVVGSFLRGGRGLVPVAIPLTLLTWILSAAPTSDLQVGTRHWTATAADLQEQYSVTLGNGDLDLTQLRLADDQTKKTSVAVGVGQTHVYLPPNVNAQVSCRTQLGDVDCLGKTDSGGYPSQVTVTDPGADGPGGGTLILDVHAGAGQVHVDRAS